MGHCAILDHLAAELAEWVLPKHCEHLQHQPKPAKDWASSSSSSGIMPGHPGGSKHFPPPGEGQTSAQHWHG